MVVKKIMLQPNMPLLIKIQLQRYQYFIQRSYSKLTSFYNELAYWQNIGNFIFH